MKQEIPGCLQIMLVNDVPTRVAVPANKQRSKRFQSMVRRRLLFHASLSLPCFLLTIFPFQVVSIQTDNSLSDLFGFPHVIFDTVLRASGFFRQMQSTQSGFRLLMECIQDPLETEHFYHRARDGKIFNRA